MRTARALLLALGLAALAAGCGADDGDDDTTGTVDAGSADGGADAAGDLPFMSACDPELMNCADGLTCFGFNNKGPHCTHDCTVDTDCEAPSPGCNGMGVCKAP